MGVGVAFSWPWIIGKTPPKDAPDEIKYAFLNRGVMLVFFAVLCFALAVLGAILIVRQARAEYSEARTENLKELIEGTQEDIRKKQNADA